MNFNSHKIFSFVISQVTDNNRVIYKSVLKLYNVSKARDNGRYQCVIVTRAGEMRSRRAKLEVFGKFLKCLVAVKRIVYECKFSLTCFNSIIFQFLDKAPC